MTKKKTKHLTLVKENLLAENSLSKNYYQKILTHDLILKQNYTTIMQLPRLEKISLNTTSKNYVNDKKTLLFTLAALEFISGQKAQLTYARKSVANFKIRQHQILGCKVVLRENLMYGFLDKLSRIILPRIRDYTKKKDFTKFQENDFNFFSKSLKKSQKSIAYSFGFNNLMIFPELENHFELVDNFRGMNLTFVLSNVCSKNSLKQTQKSANLSLILSGFQIPLF
jgi:large subunit ribosomal protein L5